MGLALCDPGFSQGVVITSVPPGEHKSSRQSLGGGAEHAAGVGSLERQHPGQPSAMTPMQRSGGDTLGRHSQLLTCEGFCAHTHLCSSWPVRLSMDAPLSPDSSLACSQVLLPRWPILAHMACPADMLPHRWHRPPPLCSHSPSVNHCPSHPDVEGMVQNATGQS